MVRRENSEDIEGNGNSNAVINEGNFCQTVIRKLGESPFLDYEEKWKALRKNRQLAGVLLLLSGDENNHEGAFIHLIKRSRRVTQGGDISCPGGMLSPRLDYILACLLRLRLLPIMRDLPRRLAKKRGPESFRLITLFLANALRETWEEIGLHPWNIKFVGTLPTYSLYTFHRTIFPLVGWIKGPWQERPSREVDKIFQLPLPSFFTTENYTRFLVTSDQDPSYRLELPGFIIREDSGNKEIIWGATFNIIMMFLRLVFDFSLPEIPEDAVSQRVLTSEYMKGNRDL